MNNKRLRRDISNTRYTKAMKYGLEWKQKKWNNTPRKDTIYLQRTVGNNILTGEDVLLKRSAEARTRPNNNVRLTKERERKTTNQSEEQWKDVLVSTTYKWLKQGATVKNVRNNTRRNGNVIAKTHATPTTNR